MVAAGVLLLVAALFEVLRATVLGQWLPRRGDDTQMFSAAFIQLILGAALLQGSDGARKFVLGMTGLAAAAAVVLTPLFARSAPFWILGGLVLLSAAGLFGLLFGKDASGLRVGLSATVVVLSWAGMVADEFALARLPELEAQKEMAEWAQAERRFSDASLGVELELPEGWMLLKDNNPWVARNEAKAVLANTKVAGFATLELDELRESADIGPDRYLDRLLRERRKSVPTTKELSRTDGSVPRASSRRLVTTWTKEGHKYRGFTTTWHDGWKYFALFSWCPESLAPEGEQAMGALEKAIAFQGGLAAQVEKASREALEGSPHLSKLAVDMVVKANSGKEISSEAIFRIAFQLSSRGLAILSAAELGEMRDLNTALYAGVRQKERDALGAYFERVRVGQPTTPEEDRAMSEVMKAAVLKMPPNRRERLQQLLEKAIAVGSVS